MDEWHDRFSEEANIGELHDRDRLSEEANTGELHDRDRLSELPDSLIIQILSLLDIKDVVRTSLVSKRWENLLSTIPCLDLLEQTPSFISSVVSLWKGPQIPKLRLSFPPHNVDPCSSVIDSWLLFAIEKRVGELYLDLSNWRDVNAIVKRVGERWRWGDLNRYNKVDYCLPQPLYSCPSITKLTLVSCKLRIEDNVQWNQLKSLEITYPDLLSGDAMNQILLGAPLLEELVLKSFKIGEKENFSIRSTSLKMLKIQTGYIWRGTTVLRIRAPNLLNLVLEARFHGTCLLDVPSLTHAILSLVHNGDVAAQFKLLNHVFRSIRHVEKVTLSYWCFEMLVKLKNKDKVMPLSNSKILELDYVDAKYLLDLVGMMFPKLERLIVEQGSRKGFNFYHGTDDEEVHNAMVDACNSLASAKMSFPSPSLLHLKTFEATWSMRDPSIIPLIRTLLKNAPILEKMVIRLTRDASDLETFILAQEKVMSMPISSPTAQLIISLI
ncbi:F-box/LRR-repeat protein At3g26922-like [Salvia miltiorrhiza]|uniref:F-box/LRR-repeat protein At3g26922-like n=1 Tax=Salvia miltiorrhiza TaxID=226208 RepID=UPI0025AC3C20|nr:F-box/LRR-repeat protein At3g26922-like [Salvia miltiorrhiza]